MPYLYLQFTKYIHFLKDSGMIGPSATSCQENELHMSSITLPNRASLLELQAIISHEPSSQLLEGVIIHFVESICLVGP